MPELKHHFRAGKMNKDLDERIVPNGEYRDAQNIEISTSEGDDVGTIQNVRGTTQIVGKTYNSNTQTITSNWSTDSFGLTNAVCIGSKLNNENDRIYWFITSDESDCIAEYDDIKGIISPVLVDTANILNWTSTDYITGINVVEGMLLWTDNKTEPKKIDIDVFKSGCAANFTTHSKYTGKKILAPDLAAASAFEEKHITVAKRAPITAPTLNMATSTRGGNGTGDNPVVVTNSIASMFATVDGDGIAAGTAVSLNFVPQPNFQVGDIITLTATYEEQASQTNYEIKVRLTNVTNSGSTCAAIIQSIPVSVPYQPLVWEALLSEEGVLFEKKMVRFGYRWKYTSGEYSTFSPFSELAFKPTSFEYLSSDGYNVGMINNLRNLEINITDTTPVDVDEIDILYKESNNQLIYVVDTLKETDGVVPTTYKLESEIIGKVVESNQMLRPWDNVPRQALAQEVTANRLIYANYLQNYNVPHFNQPEIALVVNQAPITTVKDPELSVKSLRTYQAGVVYIDEYNRQTPVFTSSGASKQTSKTYAETVNNLSVQLSNTPPSWATHFKYYIKETSNEYYNLAMDRYYLSEDGNAWLSFPSSERNKVQEDTYLILKKQHDSDVFVGVPARYKVLDISNEAPDFIKLIKKSIGAANCKVHSSNAPQIGSTTFKFLGPDPLNTPTFAAGFTSDCLIQITVGANKTEKYDIVAGGYTGEKDDDDHIYSVSIDEPLKEGETMLDGLSDGDPITITLFEEKFKRKPEFYGRFFVKINRDAAFDTNIIETYPDVQAEWGISNSRPVYANSQNSGPGDGDQEASWYDTGQSSTHDCRYITSANNGHPKMGSKFMRIYWTGAPSGSPKKKHDKSDTINSWLKSLSQAGTKFRFKGSTSNNTSEVYVVVGCTIDYQYRRCGNFKRKRLGSSKRREYKIEFEHELNKTPYEDSFTFGSDKIDEIQIVEKVIDSNNETITSDNPAIWETEPKEAIDMDLYYETGNTYPISAHGTLHTLPFHNCFSFGNGVESDRIRDDYNAIRIDKGVKVSTVLAEQYKEDRKKNGLIYSGLFNSTSGVNRLNQFIAGESITKDLNPHYGSIQKLHARNTDLVVLCEDKCLKVLANKDALYEASGNPQLTATNRVLGQAIPYVGEYGISTNPESFASYAFRVYFADKNRGAILRLSRDGLTPISDNGMKDYFKDTLPESTLILGSYDDSKGLYNLTLNNQTVSYDEKVNGFPSFKSFIPEAAVSLNNKYYSFKNGNLWVHTNESRNRFYDISAGQNDASKYYESSVILLINDIPETIKGFKTINYSGSRSKIYTNNYDTGNDYANPTSTDTPGWYCNSITTDAQSGFIKEFIKKENRYYNHIKGDATTLGNLDSQEFSVQGIGQYSAMTGDTTPDDQTVTINLTGIAQASVDAYSFDVTPTTEIHSTKSTTTMTITPDTGSTLTAGDLSVGSTGTYVDSVAFAQSGDNVIATINFADGVNMPNNDLTINLAVTGDAVTKKYLLNDLDLIYNTDDNITVTKVWSGTGNAIAEKHSDRSGLPGEYEQDLQVVTIEFNLDAGYIFSSITDKPEIRVEDTNPESYYTITFQDYDDSGSTMTIGSGGKLISDVDKRIYTIKYKFPATNTNDNIIVWNAKSTTDAYAEDNKISGYNVEGLTTVNRFESTKNVKIYGKPSTSTFTFKNHTTSTASTSGSSVTLTLSAANNDIRNGMLVTGTGVSGTVTVSNVDGTTVTLSSAQNISSTTITFSEYWTGSAWSSTATNLTVDAQGVYTVPLAFYETTVSKKYYITITPVSPTTFPDVLGKIRIARVADTSKYWEYEVTDVVDGTGYWKLTVQNATGGLSPLSTYPGGDDLLVSLYDNNGVIYSDFTDKTYDWSQNTADSDPTQGIVKANNQVPQSATILYIDEEDKTAANLDAHFTRLKDTVTITGSVYDNSTPGLVQNPFYIYQYADTTLTLTASGTGITVTSSNVTSTYTALGFPVESSSFFKVPLTITGTATSNITKDRDPELEDFTNYDSNEMDWDYELTSVTVDNSPSPKTISIVGNVYVDKYGSASTTSSLQLDNFISLASGGSSGGQIMWVASATGALGGFINVAKGTYNDGTYSRTNSKLVDIGVANNTALTGTGTIYGNFYGNTASQITLSITPGPGNTDSGTACVDGLSITKGTLSGSGASQELTYTWAGDFDEVVSASSNAEINVQVELDNEP